MSSSTRVAAVLAGAAALTFLTGGLTGAATAASSPSRLVLAPNHPTGAKPPGSGGGHGGGGTPWPGWASSNWSGYAVAGTTYTSAAGLWTVPTPAPTRQNTYSAAWVGIGGFLTGDSSLIQTGTEQDWVNGSAQYAAWWTTSDLGYAEQAIPNFVVHPGDQINASVAQGNAGRWTITLTDGGQSFSTQVTFTSSHLSAEWIMEAPGLGGRTTPLAHYGSDTFDPGTVNGNSTPAFTPADGGVLIQKNTIVSIPSNPDADTDGFTISYGATQPAAPAT